MMDSVISAVVIVIRVSVVFMFSLYFGISVCDWLVRLNGEIVVRMLVLVILLFRFVVM